MTRGGPDAIGDALGIQPAMRATIMVHINELGTSCDIIDVAALILATGASPSFIYGASGFARLLTVVAGLRSLCDRVSPLIAKLEGVNLESLVIPTVKLPDRQAAITTIATAVTACLDAIRALGVSINEVDIFRKSDTAVKLSNLTTDESIAAPSNLCWVNGEYFGTVLDHIIAIYSGKRALAVRCISGFVKLVIKRFKSTVQSLCAGTEPAVLDAWDIDSLKSTFLTPYATGIKGLSTLADTMLTTVIAYTDVSDEFSPITLGRIALEQAQVGTLLTSCTAMVGIFKTTGQSAYCTKLLASLNRPGTPAMPTQIRTKLETLAAAA
jgi:hypothetical protein